MDFKDIIVSSIVLTIMITLCVALAITIADFLENRRFRNQVSLFITKQEKVQKYENTDMKPLETVFTKFSNFPSYSLNISDPSFQAKLTFSCLSHNDTADIFNEFSKSIGMFKKCDNAFDSFMNKITNKEYKVFIENLKTTKKLPITEIKL